MDGGSATAGTATAAPRAPHEVQLQLLGISLGLLRSRVLHAATEMGVADALAAGPLTCDALAQRVNAEPDALYRLMRALAAMGVFTELDDRTFALNEMSEFLRSDSPRSVRDLVRYLGVDWNMRTLAHVAHSVRTGAAAFDFVHGVPVFEYLAHHEEDARLLDTALSRYSKGAAAAIFASYDFSRCSRLVDVGGGNGEVLCGLLQRQATMRGVLFDRPDVIESARQRIAASEVADRVDLLGGDFFDTVPSGADVYLLKNVIHDWDDERAVHILRNCRAAMRDDARVLLVETPLAGANEGEFAKLMDVGMLATTGGRERTAQEYSEILNRAGLRLLQVLPTKSPNCIVEAGA